MSNFSNILHLVESLNLEPSSIQLYAGHKEILVALPDSVIESLRNEDGELCEAYDAFCYKYGVYYASDTDCWVA